MNKKRFRFVIYFLVICLIVSSLFSCKKKGEEINNSTIVSSLLEDSNNSSVKPVVSVNPPVVTSANNKTSDTSTTPREEETRKEEASSVVSPLKEDGNTITVTSTLIDKDTTHEIDSLKNENEDEEKKEEKSLEGYTANIDVYNYSFLASVYDSYATLDYSNNPLPDSYVYAFIIYLSHSYPSIAEKVSYSISNNVITFTYPEGFVGDDESKKEVVDDLTLLIKEYIDNLESESVSLSFSIFNKNVEIDATKTSATLVFSSPLSESELDSAISYALELIPELTNVDYTINSDGSIVIRYPELSISTLSKYKEKIISYLNSSATQTPTESEKEELTVISEEAVLDITKDEESKKSPIKEEVTPITETGKVVSSFSVGLTSSAIYDFKNDWFIPDFKLRAFYTINDKLSVGIVTGYDMSGYIPLTLRAKYFVYDSFYLYGGLGYRFGFGDGRENYSSLLVEVGVGYEYKLSDKSIIFGEVGLEWAYKSRSILTPNLTIGYSYSF